MRTALAGMAASMLVAASTPAAADWQYTQWGMTPAEVVAASNGVARENPDRALDAGDLKAELVAPYQGSALPFTAVFLFGPRDRLSTVTLNPVGHIACPVIVQVLDAKYGTPEGRSDMIQARTMRWDDENGDNLVVYLDLGDGNCTIQYSRLPPTQPDGKGL